MYNKINIVESKFPPVNKNDWWFDLNTEILKQWKNGGWQSTLPMQLTPNIGLVLYSTTDDSVVTTDSEVLNNGTIAVLTNNYIQQNAYKNKSTLETVVLLEGIKYIGENAFEKCTSLHNVILPNSLEEIRKSAFYGCDNLLALNIPDGIQRIEPQALPTSATSTLNNLSGKGVVDNIYLTNRNSLLFTVPLAAEIQYNKLTNHGQEVTGISVIPLSLPAVSTIVSRGFSFIAPYFDEDDTSIGITLNIPKSVVNIDPSAFMLTAPSIEKFTGKYASSDGLYLCKDNVLMLYAGHNTNTEANIADGIVRINLRAFQNSLHVTTIKLPKSIKSIGEYAFYGCSKLTSIYCAATTPPVLDKNKDIIPSNITKIYVPSASVNAYKSATNWATFASKITGYNF